jgi:hypothetical protein
MSEAERWIRARLAGAPPALLEAMVNALPRSDAGAAEGMAEGAAALYARLLGDPDDREAALPLLAADALMTHALQACAEADMTALREFAARWGAAGRLGGLGEGSV